jgi:hypothetical protein
MRVLADRRIGGSAEAPDGHAALASSIVSADPPIRRSADFWIPIGAMTLLIVSRIPETLVLLRLQDLGVAVATIPVAWAGLHVVRSLAAYPGGVLSDRIGPRAMLAVGAVLFGSVLLALARGVSAGSGIVIFLVLGVVTGLSEASDRQVVAALSSGGAGRAFGNAQALAGIAALPAGLAFGALYQQVGGPAALKASAAATLVSLAIWLASTRGRGLSAPRPAT